MNYMQIESLLKSSEWFNVPNTPDYYAKGDIFLGFHFTEWNEIQKADLPENISCVRNQLLDKFKINGVECSQVLFEYQNRQLYSVKLYHFHGSESGKEGSEVNVYFAKPESSHNTVLVTDPFYLALIRSLNNDRALSFLNYATGQTFKD